MSHKDRQKKYYLANKKKISIYQKNRRQTHREETRIYDRKQRLKQKFNMTINEYDELLKKQGNVCAICGKELEKGKRLAVDHNHKTGKIRGLLCVNCNMMLGMSKDNINTLKNAIKYLEE